MTSVFRRHLPALALVLATALALRFVWAVLIHPDPAAGWYGGDEGARRFDDTVWYRGAAHHIALGHGYVNPFSGTPTAAWPPGYPAFLGSIFKLFGEGNTQAIAGNVIVSVLTVAVVYGIGLLLFERRTALIGAGAVAVWPGQIFFSSLTLSEPLFTLLFATAVLLALVVPQAGKARAPTIVVFGLVMGASTLTRGQGLLLLPLAVAVWVAAGMRWRGAIGWGILAAFVTAVMLAPWIARNQQKLGSPVIVSTNFGANLWLGNHDGATGRMSIREPEPPQPARGDKTQSEYEVAADNLALRKGLSYMLHHPADELRLSRTKLRAMYESDATAIDWNSGYGHGYYRPAGAELTLRRLANAFWFAALAFAAVGVIACRSRLRGPIGLLPLLVVVWTASHLVFFGDSRFHYPLVFAFALMAARGLVVIFEALRRPQPSLDGRYAAA